MTFGDHQTDELLGMVTSLRTHDVSQPRADCLRTQCHAELRSRPRWNDIFEKAFRRFIGPALGGAWSLAYLLDLIRRAVALYGS